jgi:hypothetical protein
MRASIRRLAVIVLFISAPSASFAWGPAGHKIVASIAFRQLTASQQQKIIAILKSHPRFQKDFKGKMPDGVDEIEWLFQQAAVWPDLAKGLAPDLKAKYSRPNWHFIDLPYYPTKEDENTLKGSFSLNVAVGASTDADENMNLVQAMKFAQKVLADKHAADSDKAMYLSWIFHLVGDAHQPLHAATLCVSDIFPEGDHGGNWIPTTQGKELHALWDGFPGSPHASFQTLKNKAVTLSSNSSLKTAAVTAASDLDIESWAKETHALAESEAYTQEVLDHLDGHTDRADLPKLDLSDDYLKNGGAVAQKQLVVAGFRLAAILKEIADR